MVVGELSRIACILIVFFLFLYFGETGIAWSFSF